MGLLPMAEEQQSSSNPLLLPQPRQPYYGVPVQEPPATYILLTAYPRRHRPSSWCASLPSSSSLLLLAFALLLLLLLLVALFFLFPSDPVVSVARLRLRHLHVSALPRPQLDISLALKIKIRNRDFFSLDYRSIVVSIGYRGKRLGFVTSGGGRIRARGVSYVDAELKLDGIRISDVFYLIEDIARGSIPFDTVTEVDGQLHVLFFDIPVDGRISCAVTVNPENQTVVRQDCYPE